MQFGNPETLPLHVVFPEQYAASKKQIVRDFARIVVVTVTFVVALNLIVG
jgi:hypothetical protein